MIEANARQMFEYARAAFKGSLKSSNKVYSYDYGSASDKKKTYRSGFSDRADNAIVAYRSRGYRAEDLLAKSPGDRAGNCSEMTQVALHCAALNRIPDVWRVAASSDHVFCVVGLPSSPSLLASISSMTSPADGTMEAYVCDVWAGIVCAYTSYPHHFLGKMATWESQGKEIDIGFDETDPDGGHIRATNYGARLVRSPASLVRVTDTQGNKIFNSSPGF
ncbi:hypothetical protein KNO81_41935 [Paraburkholderia sediminicola]|jgi:hypothetical protein|nr:hypothetical protein [Paraburkholderia sediminicola]